MGPLSAANMRTARMSTVLDEVKALIPTIKIVQTALVRLGSTTPVVGVSIKIGKKSIFLGEISRNQAQSLNRMIIDQLVSISEKKCGVTSLQYNRQDVTLLLSSVDFKVTIDFDHGTTVKNWDVVSERARGSNVKHDKRKYDKGISRLKELFKFYNFSEADIIETWKVSEVEKVIKE